MSECPCRNCNNRSATCHGTCKAYKEWSQENEEFRKKKSTTKNINRMVDEEVVSKYLRKKRKKER